MTSSQNDRLSRAVKPGYGIKTPVIVASTGNLTLSGSTQTIDGVAVSTGRVLVKDQTLPHENGIYDVGSGSWSRAKDFDGTGDAVWGLLVPVNAGTVSADLFAKLTSTGTGDSGAHVIDSTAETLTFTMYSQFQSVTGILDDLGTESTGAILYRSSAAWVPLAAGATGTVLTANGTSTAPSWQVAADVSSSSTSSDNEVVRFSGTNGKVIQRTGIVVSDTDQMRGHGSNVSRTSSTALVLSSTDGGTIIELTSTQASNTITAPSSTSETLNVGFQTALVPFSTTTFTVGVQGTNSLLSRSTNHIILSGKYQMATVYKSTAATYLLAGAIST